MKTKFKNPRNRECFEAYETIKTPYMRNSLRSKYSSEAEVEKRLKGQIAQFRCAAYILEDACLCESFDTLTPDRLHDAMENTPSKRGHMKSFVIDGFIYDIFNVDIETLIEGTDNRTGTIIHHVYELAGGKFDV